jgi:hypothetical protein
MPREVLKEKESQKRIYRMPISPKRDERWRSEGENCA